LTKIFNEILVFFLEEERCMRAKKGRLAKSV